MPFPASLPIPPSVVAIARRLEEAGHETWCVGGAVRDNLLGIPTKDVDLATAAAPDVVRRLFRRTIPVGIEHGTVAVLDEAGAAHEVTTFRADVRTDGRHAEVAFGVSLDEDLARRDFTINAIAYHPLRHEWRDPFAGERDLAMKVIRAVGDPGQRFREDYLRIVRALRFAARFGFAIEAETWEAARAEVAGVARLSAERVRDEWFKGLAGAQRPGGFATSWAEIGALELWLPEIGQRGRGPGRWDPGVLDRFPVRDPVLMTSFLSADPAATLTRLRCSNAEIERGRLIGALRGVWPAVMADAAVRTWLAEAGPAADDLVTIAEAEGWGGELADAVARVRASHAPLAIGDLAVTGTDIMALGISEGPEVGIVLDALLDLVLVHPELNTRDDLLHAATRLTAEMPLPPQRRSRRASRPSGITDPRGPDGTATP
jgi:tRNA nucleotidyltransferase (CCA-adding enzyme)